MKQLFFFSILMLFVFSFLVSAQSDFQEIGVDASADDASAGEGALTALTRVFSLADKPTEITFTRTLSIPFNEQSNVGSITETASFKISGRLKEIDPASSDLTRYADRAFEFQNGTIEWNFQQNSDDAGTSCRRQQIISSSNSDTISNLDIPFDTNGGKDVSGNYVHLNNYDLKIIYNLQGLSGKSEFSIVGQLLIPIDYTQIETPIQSSSNVRETCNGNPDPSTFTQKKQMVTQFPVTLLNFDTDQTSQTGQLVATEPTGNQFEGTVVSSSQEAEFTKFVHVTPISLGGDQSPWNVNWKIELPTPGEKIEEIIETLQEIDTDRDGLTDLEERTYGTDINNRDTDGDGLLDSWEVNGVYIGGVNALDLPSMGSHPLKKDVFLEIDWMQNATHSHKPENGALQRVINAFATKGIRLHIDTGQWSGGNSVPEQPLAAWHRLNFINFSEEPTYLDNNRYLFDIKKDNFNSKRIGIFYYGIFVHERSDSSGQAEVGGNFFVALPFDDTIAAKSGTLMHEFGHTLQLGHGGRLDNELQYDSTQFKPNYRSIMNYHFQFNGIPRINQSGAIIYDLDYSEEALADLNESAGLNEANGLTSLVDPSVVSFYSCVNAGHGLNAPDVMYSSGSNLVPWFVLNGSGVDWDCDGTIAGNPKISVNGFDGSQFNNSGPLELMVGRSDWDKVVLKIGCGDYGLESEITDENKIRVGRLWGNCSELADIRESLGYSGESDTPTLPPRYPFIGEACDGVDNDSDGQVDEGCSDKDGDRVVDELDNCPDVANEDQRDSDNDFIGDACSEGYFFSKAIVGAESNENVQDEQTETIQNEVISNLNQNSENQPTGQLAWLGALFGFDFSAMLLALGAAVLIGGIVLILLILFILKKLSRK